MHIKKRCFFTPLKSNPPLSENPGYSPGYGHNVAQFTGSQSKIIKENKVSLQKFKICSHPLNAYQLKSYDQ